MSTNHINGQNGQNGHAQSSSGASTPGSSESARSPATAPGPPADIGIVNMEIYFPSQFVEQAELERFDGVEGKYTKGLGQRRMAFVTDREDVASLCLTAVSRLVKKSGIGYADIGRLEVGTETLLDKSKSVKTALMDLFAGSGNSDVEGVHSTNACYGGTAALFNSAAWCAESSEYDGRYAVVVCADIAVYEKGPARATGGAGAVAMLVGRNAALVLDRGLRATHVENVYDFYKPNMESEYPVVDGGHSVQCYLRALDKSYELYCAKAARQGKLAGSPDGASNVSLDRFDAVCFHSPFSKLVQKSLARLALNDYLRAGRPNSPELEKALGADKLAALTLEGTYADRGVMDAFLAQSRAAFLAKTEPSLLVAKNVGNMYTPSLYGGLVSYIASVPRDALPGKRVGLFSYGSGLVASFFSMTASGDASPGSALDLLCRTVADVQRRLDARAPATADEFDAEMDRREKYHHAAPYAPSAGVDSLFPDTFYLSGVDERHRRTYAVHRPATNGH